MDDRKKLLEMRQGQVASLKAMIVDLKNDGTKLKSDNVVLSKQREILVGEE
jgi:hypothetical protein